VRSKDLIQARVRTPGTIASLKADEGDSVEQGQVLALVGDPKIALRIKALDARITADESRVETAKTELERSQTLKEKGFASQARVDQAQTAYDVALNELKSARAERSVIETEIEEGQVLAPTSGRVLKVPVTEGSVVLAGESIATIAANEYLLRLELPERHARFMKVGDPVRVGARGLGPDEAPLAQGRITQVYPELDNGRVVADAEVPDLGSYFVGERVLVWISAGKRQTFLVPL
jgi:RND family efflux transporter MFP subunit